MKSISELDVTVHFEIGKELSSVNYMAYLYLQPRSNSVYRVYDSVCHHT